MRGSPTTRRDRTPARTPARGRSRSEGPSFQHTPRQWDAQQLVEREVNDQRGDQRHGKGDAPGSAEQAHPNSEQHDAGDMEAERVGGEHVEHQSADERGDARACARAMDPLGSRDPRRALAHPGADEQRAAQRETDGDQAGKPGRAEFLSRHRRESLDVPEDDPGEDDERRARQRIVELYLASPTAFSAAPRFVSESAMNFVVAAGSAHTTPKPRLAMKSLYSFES